MSDSAKLMTELKAQLVKLLDGGQAHATFDDAVKDFPAELRGVVPEKLPYSAWQIVEHLRLAQKDILEYSDNEDGSYKPMKWPEDYWPKEAAPESDEAWDESLKAIRSDRKAFDALLEKADAAEMVKLLRGARARTCCARRYSLPTIMRITWVN